MATHSNILAWRIQWTERAWWAACRLWGRTESDMTEVTQQQHESFKLKVQDILEAEFGRVAIY